jgi:hypothetical protein
MQQLKPILLLQEEWAPKLYKVNYVTNHDNKVKSSQKLDFNSYNHYVRTYVRTYVGREYKS